MKLLRTFTFLHFHLKQATTKVAFGSIFSWLLLGLNPRPLHDLEQTNIKFVRHNNIDDAIKVPDVLLDLVVV